MSFPSDLDFIFGFMLILARVCSTFFMLPAIGDPFVNARMRVSLGVTISFLLYPVLKDLLPKYTDAPALILFFLAIEIFIGITIGLVAKLILTSVHIVGTIISMQSGLASATMMDPTQKAQTAVMSGFMMVFLTAAVMVTDTHHVFLHGIVDSFQIFKPATPIIMEDFTELITTSVNQSFIIGFKISAPYIIISMAILVGNGVLSRLMPAFQVFFVVSPAQILIAFVVLMISLSASVEKIISSITEAMSVFYVY